MILEDFGVNVRLSRGAAIVDSQGRKPSLLHTSGSQFFVPKGHLTIAHQFTAGELGNQHGLRPVGMLECGISRHGFNRPSGTNGRISRFLTQR